MHELTVTQNMLDIAIKHAEAARLSKISKINLVLGELSGVAGNCVQFYFDILKENSIAKEASLNFDLVPAQLKCRRCLLEFAPEETTWACPRCQNQEIEVIDGRDFYMESLEGE